MANYCLNKNLPEIVELSKITNTPVEFLSTMIASWQVNNNKTQDEFPDLQQFRQHYFNNNVDGVSMGKIKIVKEYYREDASAGVAVAKDILGKDAVSDFSQGKSKDSRGRTEFRYTVKAPENVDYMTTGEHTRGMLKELTNTPDKKFYGEVNLSVMLKHIADFSTIPRVKYLAEKYLESVKDIPIRFTYGSIDEYRKKSGLTADKGALGVYVNGARKIIIDRDFIIKSVTEANPDKSFDDINAYVQYLERYTILHETTHALANHAYMTNAYFQANIDGLYYYAKQKLDPDGSKNIYGLTNAREFIAETMSSASFQQMLAGIEYKNASSSLFEEFINTFLKFLEDAFKIKTNDTLLKETVTLITQFIPAHNLGVKNSLLRGEDILEGREGLSFVQGNNDLFTIENENPNQINYSLKAVALITKNLAKVKAWEKQVQNPPVFWEKLQKDLGIPQTQIDLLRASKGNTIEEKLLDFAAKYSQVIEINVATTKEPYIPLLKDLEYDVRDNPKRDYYEIWGDNVLVEGGFESIRDAKNRIKELQDKVTKNKERKEKLTQTYTDLTAHGKKDPMDVEGQWGGSRPYIVGDWEYKELKIQVPNIALVSDVLKHKPFNEPSTIAHVRASFNEKTGEVIVHEFQSDPFQDNAKSVIVDNLITGEKTGEKQAKERAEQYRLIYNDVTIKKIVKPTDKLFKSINPEASKLSTDDIDEWHVTGRERKSLIGNKGYYVSSIIGGFIVIKGINTSLGEQNDIVSKTFTTKKEAENEKQRLIKEDIDIQKDISNNQFLQLLNQKDNWIAFGINSIIQQAAKQGFTSIKFPVGDTAIQIEGGNTVEELKKVKEDRIKYLEEDETNYVYKYKLYQHGSSSFELHNSKSYKTKKQAEKHAKIEWGEKNKSKLKVFHPDNSSEINQLKKELKTLETQGLTGMFGGVYNFYERTVKNVLQKSGYNPKEVTDKYGNEFNEVEINAEVKAKTQTVLFSFDKDATQDEQLGRVLKSVLTKLGVNYKSVEAIYDKSGEIIKDATGEAQVQKNIAGDLLKFVKLVEKEAGIGGLTEETVHMVIEMLPKNGSLFQGMYKQIQNFKEYEEIKNDPDYIRQYGDNDYLIRKEAMGKLIKRIIIDKDYDPTAAEVKKAMTWWDKILEFFGKKFQVNKVTIDIFKDFANKILNEDFEGLNLSDKNLEEGSLYNIEQKPNEIQKPFINKLDADHENMTRHFVKNSEGDEDAYYTTTLKNGVEKKIDTTVTKLAKKQAKKMTRDLTPRQEKKAELLKNFGLAFHQDIQNAIERVIDPAVVKVAHTQFYDNKLEAYAKSIVKAFPKGTIFRLERRGKTEDNKVGTTFDFLAIEPDGTFNILDWKTTNFSALEKDTYKGMAKWKTSIYKYQINYQSKMLRENYGAKKFGYIRLMPADVSIWEDFNGDRSPVVTGVRLGAIKGLSSQDAYLTPVPIDNEPGDKPVEYDEFVNKLNSIYDKFSKIKTKDTSSGIEKAKALGKFQAAIRQIQIDANLNGFAEFAIDELEDILISLKSDNQEEIDSNIRQWALFVDTVEFIKKNFSALYEKENIKKEKTGKSIFTEEQTELNEKVKEKFLETIPLLDKVNAHINLYNEAKLNGLAAESKIKNYKDSGIALGSLQHYFTNLNMINHPIFKMLWNLISKAQDKLRLQNMRLKDDINKFTEGLGQDDYDKIINPKTGNLIQVYNDKYYAKIDDLIDAKKFDELTPLLTIDHVGLKEHIAKKKKEISELDIHNRAKQRKLAAFITDYDIYNSPSALKMLHTGNDNWLGVYIKKTPASESLKQQYYTKEFIDLSKNKKLLAFYEFFKERMDDYIKKLPMHLPGNFVPNLEKLLLERLTTDASGLMGKEGLWDIIKNNVAPEGSYVAEETDEHTGHPKKVLPIYFVKSVNNKSADLPKLLYLFGNMANNYAHMEQIEHSTSMLRNALEHDKSVVTGGTGNTLTSPLTGNVQTQAASMKDLELFDDYVGHYIYGKRYKENLGHFTVITKKKIKNPDTGEIEEFETETDYDKAQLLSNIQNLFIKTKLGANPVSGFAAIFGATANATLTAVAGKFFNLSQFYESVAELTTGTSVNATGISVTKGVSITHTFDLANVNNSFQTANELSSQKLNHFSISNGLMFMLRLADNGVSNAVLLSMLKNHGISAEGKVKLLKQLPENTKSIYEQIITNEDGTNNLLKTDKNKNGVLTEEQFSFMRNKTYRLMEGIVGMGPRNMMNGAKLSIWGSMIMTFKTWMPMLVHERTSALNFDNELDSVTMGKYRTFYKAVFTKRTLPMLAEVMKTMVGIKNSAEFDARIRELYDQEFKDNVTLDKDIITFPEYKEMYIANIKSAVIEAVIVIAGSSILMLAKGSDDPKHKFLIKALDRAIGEFTFFISPTQFIKMVGNPIPVMSYIGELWMLIQDLVGEGFGYATGDDERIGRNKPLKHAMKMIPVANELEKWMDVSQSEK